MKKPSSTTNKQSGFVLPIVLFAAVIIMTAISTQIYIYKHDLQITANYLEQVTAETLFQMSLSQAKKDLPSIDHFPAHLSYQFQDGHVIVHIPKKDSQQVTFHIHTDEQDTETIINHFL